MSKIQIDWSKSEGGRFLKNAGEYIVKLEDYEVDESAEGNQYIRWSIKVVEGNWKDASSKFVTSLSHKSLWKLEELLNAVQYPVTRGSVQDLDLDDVIEKAKPFAIEFVEGREREDGKGYYLQAEDFMALDEYKKSTEDAPKKEAPVERAPESKKEATDDEFKRLEELIDKLDLPIDLEDYDTFEEARLAVDKAIAKKNGLAPKPTVYTEDMIETLRGAELDKLAQEIGLEFEEDASPRSKRRSLMKALEKEGRLK